jgi:hypothetical protein
LTLVTVVYADRGFTVILAANDDHGPLEIAINLVEDPTQ